MMAIRNPLQSLFVVCLLLCAGCATPSVYEEGEDEAYATEPEPAEESVTELEAAQAEPEAVPDAAPEAAADEGEVPLAVAETESKELPPSSPELAEVVVQAKARHEQIHDLVAEAQALLKDTKLQYAFTGKGKREILRGRPVAFALWSEAKMAWTIAEVEIPRPPVKWRPGGRPMAFTLRTPGIQARHVKGTGAERLMFSFTRDGEPLKVYGRKFPVFDSVLLKKKRWREVAATAKAIVYLPFTQDTLDPLFVAGGRDYLLSTARQAVEDLRAARVPSRAYPGMLMADVVPPEVITTLAIIEQTDDGEFRTKGAEAFNEVLSQYGLKKGEAYRYSVSRAAAIGPMQFTNKRRNGTYSMVVRRCPEARIDPDFERGATNLLNAMKAAICLFDIELGQMRANIREAYRDNMKVLGIFPVAAYNGGPRNVNKLYKVIQRMNVDLAELRAPGEESPDERVQCPCLWREVDEEIRPVAIPRYNNENRWYIEKYQNILGSLE
jgi:hypothetical protein